MSAASGFDHDSALRRNGYVSTSIAPRADGVARGKRAGSLVSRCQARLFRQWTESSRAPVPRLEGDECFFPYFGSSRVRMNFQLS
jgi:hypothetical protein